MNNHRFVNVETNIEAYVEYAAKGFNVRVKDLDADMFLPTIMNFVTESKAIEYAKKIVEA